MADTLCIIPQDDGYTEPFYVKAIPGVYGSVRGRFRPLTHPERQVVTAKVATLAPVESSHYMLRTVCTFVKEWDIKNEKGAAVPLEPAKVFLRGALLDRLFNIVCGFDGGDIDPEAGETKEQAIVNLEADLKAAAVGPTREELDLKN